MNQTCHCSGGFLRAAKLSHEMQTEPELRAIVLKKLIFRISFADLNKIKRETLNVKHKMFYIYYLYNLPIAVKTSLDKWTNRSESALNVLFKSHSSVCPLWGTQRF